MKENAVLSMMRSGQAVFRVEDLALLWRIDNQDYLKSKVYRLVKRGALIRLRSGIFALSRNYDPLLVANKLVSPSYISIQTILSQAGAIFQYDSCIYSIAQLTTEKKVDSKKYVYRKIRDQILFQKHGIIIKNNITQATPERAFLDWLYLNPMASVDNLSILNQKHCLDLVTIYQNRSLERRLIQCFKENDMK